MRTKGIGEMECSSCGSMATIVRGMYPFKESGLKNVVLAGIELIKCPNCGNIDPIIPHMDELMRVLGMAVLSQPNRLRGDEVRFLRKLIGKTGKEFCELLNIDKSTLSKWENDEDPVGGSNDRLIRVIVCGLGDAPKEQLVSMINRFRKTEEDNSRQREIKIDADKMSYQYV